MDDEVCMDLDVDADVDLDIEDQGQREMKMARFRLDDSNIHLAEDAAFVLQKCRAYIAGDPEAALPEATNWAAHADELLRTRHLELQLVHLDPQASFTLLDSVVLAWAYASVASRDNPSTFSGVAPQTRKDLETLQSSMRRCVVEWPTSMERSMHWTQVSVCVCVCARLETARVVHPLCVPGCDVGWGGG